MIFFAMKKLLSKSKNPNILALRFEHFTISFTAAEHPFAIERKGMEHILQYLEDPNYCFLAGK